MSDGKYFLASLAFLAGFDITNCCKSKERSFANASGCNWKRREFAVATKEFSKKKVETEYYARQWFASMANYHCINNRDGWQFDEVDVISFLKSKVEQKMPTWKRLGIVN